MAPSAQFQLFDDLSPDEYAALKEDIRLRGVLVPVELDEHGAILDGHHRVRACDELGIDFPRIVRVFGSDQEKRAHVRAINLLRRHLNTAQKREVIADQIKDTPELPDRQIAAMLGVSHHTVAEVRKELELSGQIAQIAARTVTRGGSTFEQKAKKAPAISAQSKGQAKSAVKIAQKGLDLPDDKPLTLSQANGLVKQAARAETAALIAAEPRPLPDGQYRVIVADPPWRYEKRPDDPTHRAALPYADMDLNAIRRLPVSERAHRDCILWLWTTNAHMREAYSVLDAWGFTAKTILTWVKDSIGTGDWLRGQTEHCLLAVRGRPTVMLTNQSTVIRGPIREHSRKPDSFYDLVTSLCPGYSTLELFARETRPGWAAWGAEQEKFDGATGTGLGSGTGG